MLMRHYNPALVVDILRKEYPEVNKRILQRIDNDIPMKLDDLELIPCIIKSFKVHRGVDHSEWINKLGSRDISEDRELLLSVVMLFFHPEKLIQLTTEKARYGVMSKMSGELNCGRDVLKKSLTAVIVAFRVYKSFHEEAYRLYELIKIENKFFEYGKAE